MRVGAVIVLGRLAVLVASMACVVPVVAVLLVLAYTEGYSRGAVLAYAQGQLDATAAASRARIHVMPGANGPIAGPTIPIAANARPPSPILLSRRQVYQR